MLLCSNQKLKGEVCIFHAVGPDSCLPGKWNEMLEVFQCMLFCSLHVCCLHAEFLTYEWRFATYGIVSDSFQYSVSDLRCSTSTLVTLNCWIRVVFGTVQCLRVFQSKLFASNCTRLNGYVWNNYFTTLGSTVIAFESSCTPFFNIMLQL